LEDSVRTTSNPVIRNLLVATAASTSSSTAPAGKRRRFQLRAATGAERPLTVDDVVTKTGIAAAIVLASAVLAAVLDLSLLLVPAALAGLGLMLYSLFRPRPAPGITIGYSIAQGVVLGLVVEMFESVHPGVATQAVLGTGGVFAGMLVIYRTRILRVTPKFVQWGIAAIFGSLALLLVNLTAFAAFDTDLGIRGGGALSITLSLVFIAIAAVSLLLNFHAADQMIRLGVSEKWAWYLAFGLIGTLVWLYLEILWLLAPVPGQ
jgi:uncharacterized YccA/Bax inhibitor family protein